MWICELSAFFDALCSRVTTQWLTEQVVGHHRNRSHTPAVQLYILMVQCMPVNVNVQLGKHFYHALMFI